MGRTRLAALPRRHARFDGGGDYGLETNGVAERKYWVSSVLMTDQVPLRISSIGVRGLFGVFDHSIQLDGPSNVTIIHGPNGFGKTMLLTMVQAFVEGKFDVFHRVPFDEFRLEAENVTVRFFRVGSPEGSDRSALGRRNSPQLTFELTGGGFHEKGPVRPTLRPLPGSVLRMIDHAIPRRYALAGTNWVDRETGEKFSAADMLDLFPHAARQPIVARYLRVPPVGLRAFREKLRAYFIHTKRLHGDETGSDVDPEYMEVYSPHSTGLSVERYSRELAQVIEQKLADYGKHSQQLDRTFPARLVEFIRGGGQKLEPDQILTQLAELDEKRQNLTRIGFLDPEMVLENISRDDVVSAAEALTIYVDDMRKKLGVLDDIEQRVTRFMDIINSRFSFKRLEVNRRAGFIVRNQLNANSTRSTIHLKDLSSGEQHELVVLSELLFKVPAGALILIDEPELSLHAAWQASFLDDLIGILEVNSARALVATHSPVIIGERWDLTQRLEAPKEFA